jgi:hypothetical protein
MSIVQLFLGLGATAIAAACGFVIALSRQVSALTTSVESMAEMWAQERQERIASVERIHERIDNTPHRRKGEVHL